ncbi:hypothetical protein [Caviibacterium pharyngocola]|nr:hypothetical protein [Caviibacterium pharyngocola]
MNPVFYLLGIVALIGTIFLGLLYWANADLLCDKKQTNISK